jgi:hypothetical protein
MLPALWGEQDCLGYNSLASIVSPASTIYIAEVKEDTTTLITTILARGGSRTSAAASTTASRTKSWQ